jgi:hypothetical protein
MRRALSVRRIAHDREQQKIRSPIAERLTVSHFSSPEKGVIQSMR